MSSKSEDKDRAEADSKVFDSSIIGLNQKIQNVVNLIEKIANSPLNVLITGESGTGKELAARTIHINSSRADRPFIDINCAALPESLLESELFGIEKGVATGVDKRLGKIEASSGGTLFLDEIGDMSLSAQAKLLRVLQERKMERIGGRNTIDVDVRVIAATNKDLKKEIKAGRFREDLYYRLNTVHIYMPSLREIKTDIPILAKYFLNKFTTEFGKAPMSFSPKAINCLVNYDWPGNIRELQNEIKRAAILAEGSVIDEKNFSDSVIEIQDKSFDGQPNQKFDATREMDFEMVDDSTLGPGYQSNLSGNDSSKESPRFLRGTVEVVEIQKIKEALDITGGNKQKASQILGITRQGLIYKMKRYGLLAGAKPKNKCKRCGRNKPQENELCVECCNKLSETIKPPETTKLNEQEAQPPRDLYESNIVGKNDSEGERKLVTVIVVGICDLSKLSNELDPEEVRNLMNKCFGIVSDEVYKYGGTISQFTRDGVIALFGAPIALEDHSYRAVNASLEIQRAIKGYVDKIHDERSRELRITIGIDTGLAVLGTISHHSGIQYTAVGDAVNIASYLQYKAEPDKVFISTNTQKLVGGNFLTRPLGKITIDGRSEAIKVYELIGTKGTRTRIDIQIERGLTHFTGRERELGILKDCLKETNEGRGQVVFVVGEPGVGKSRLLLEFRKSLSKHTINWFEGKCITYGNSIAYLPLTEILKKIFQIADKTDNEREILKKIEEGALLLGSDLEQSIQYFKYLLSGEPGEDSGSTTNARYRRAEIFEALRRIIIRQSEIKPLILVIEDLHWIDKTSQEFLTLLVNSIPAYPVLLILTYRPDFSHSLGEKTYYTRIALRNLNHEESIRMAESLLEAIVLPEELRELIIQKAEGNPFFIEELIRSLIESAAITKNGAELIFKQDVSQIKVPDSIQDILMARIDRLGDRPKKVLQVGSVIGREFGFKLLKNVSSLGDDELRDLLLALRNTELIHEKGVSLDANYVFKHALTHEVAYNSLLIQRRIELHEKTGIAIEEMYINRIDEFYEVLAYHFSRTNNKEKAFYYLTMAGKKAKSVFAMEEALGFFNHALTCLDELPKTETYKEKRIDILLEMENIYDATINREKQGKVLATLIELSEELNNKRRVSDVYIKQAEYLSVIGSFAEAEATIKSALLLNKELGDKTGEGKALRGMGFIYWSAGKYDNALKCHQEALDIHRKLGSHEAEGFELVSLGEIYRKLGRYEEALSSLREASRICDRLHNLSAQHVCKFNIGSVYRDMGDYQACLEYYLECWRIVKEEVGFGNLNLSGHLSVPSGIASTYWHLGNYQESLRYYGEALDISRGLNDKLEEGIILTSIASIHNLLGDHRKSIDYFEEALRVIREIGDKAFVRKILILIGDKYSQNLKDYQRAVPYYLESLEIEKESGPDEEIRGILNRLGVANWNLGHYETALNYYQQALEICKMSGNRIGEGITLSSIGVVYLSLSEHENALKCSVQALNILKESGDQKSEGYILNSIGNIHYEMGDHNTARKFYRHSLKIRESLGDRKGEAWVLHNLGKVHMSLKNYEESEKHYKQALLLAEELKEEELIRTSKLALSQISL